MSKLLLAAFLLIGVFAHLTIAASTDLDTDLRFFESTIRTDSGDQKQEELDLQWEQGSDLIRVEVGSGAVEIGEGEFVTFKVGTTLVTLKDVPRKAWFGPYVRDAAERGIISGYRDAKGNFTGEFKPAHNVSVEELAKMAFVASGGDYASCPAPTNSGALTSWSRSYIGCAEKAEWVLFADHTVDIKRPALRSEVVITVLQAFKVPVKELTGTGTLFTDVSPSIQFGSAIVQAANDGLVSGYTDAQGNRTGIFGPNDPVRRAEIAKIISLALQLYDK
jgi:hypothetical protein